MLVGYLNAVDLPIMIFSSKVYMLTDTPAPRQPFSQLALMAEQMRTSVPPLGRAVQSALVRMSSSLSRPGPGGEAIPGKYNFGVGTGGGRI